MSKNKETPIIFGEQIENSMLVRRFQGEWEVSPQYVRGEKETVWEAEINSQLEAARHGYRSVISDGATYVELAGQWYHLN